MTAAGLDSDARAVKDAVLGGGSTVRAAPAQSAGQGRGWAGPGGSESAVPGRALSMTFRETLRKMGSVHTMDSAHNGIHQNQSPARIRVSGACFWCLTGLGPGTRDSPTAPWAPKTAPAPEPPAGDGVRVGSTACPAAALDHPPGATLHRGRAPPEPPRLTPAESSPTSGPYPRRHSGHYAATAVLKLGIGIRRMRLGRCPGPEVAPVLCPAPVRSSTLVVHVGPARPPRPRARAVTVPGLCPTRSPSIAIAYGKPIPIRHSKPIPRAVTPVFSAGSALYSHGGQECHRSGWPFTRPASPSGVDQGVRTTLEI